MKIKEIFEKLHIRLMRQDAFQNYLRKQGVSIGKECSIYKNVQFGTEPYLISLGNHVRLTDNVRFITHDGGMWVIREVLRDNRVDIIRPIVIKDNVFVGWGAMILPGVTIGENSVIAAGAVVTKDVPANEIWGGTPARCIKKLDQYIEDNRAHFLYTHTMSPSEKREYLLKTFKSENT